MLFAASDAWRAAYPGASAGILVMRDAGQARGLAGVASNAAKGQRPFAINPPEQPELRRVKRDLEETWRQRLQGADRAAIRALPEIAAYNAYYKRFGQTYHLQLQLESVALKGRDIPDVAALVEAMFMAELKNLLLTAGHDLAAIAPPITLSVASGDETFTRLNGRPATAYRGDMLMFDGRGVISTVLQGPDDRTAITTETRDVVFAVYAPEGIAPDAVRRHLEDIAANVRLVSPEARVESLDVYSA
jgi:DNA/RNA-binding domain of Phe-tRNA-synthetase-like protein